MHIYDFLKFSHGILLSKKGGYSKKYFEVKRTKGYIDFIINVGEAFRGIGRVAPTFSIYFLFFINFTIPFMVRFFF